MTRPAVLEVRSLTTELAVRGRRVAAVDHVSFTLHERETLGLVGESGCGKSLTALSLLRLLRDPPARIVSGEVLYRGRNLLGLSETEMCRVRGPELSMVFQEPMTSLNPIFRVGRQIGESVRLHQGASRPAARARSIDLLRKVGISAAEERVDAYPHELSGGMRQRVMMAIAIACNPSVLIADEPTTALDVTVQAQILRLLRDLQTERGLSVLLITHDLGVVAEMCERVLVMYAGHVVEDAPVDALFARPAHPYTQGLLRSMPTRTARERLQTIPGTVPSLAERPDGCRFRARCERASAECREVDPPLEEKRPFQRAACHHPLPA